MIAMMACCIEKISDATLVNSWHHTVLFLSKYLSYERL